MERQPSSTPEHERQTERNPFNIDAMTDQDIIETGRMLAAAADALGADEPDQAKKLDDLWEKLQKAIRQLPAYDLDRARQLLALQMNSGNVHDLESAAMWADSLHEYDYELARDTLVRIYADPSLGGALDMAALRLSDLQEHLTPEQIADYNARLAQYDPRVQM